MIQFEALTASHAVVTRGFMKEMQGAAAEVLGGAIELPEEPGGGLVLMGAEELAIMHKITGALGGMSVAELMRATSAELPESFSQKLSLKQLDRPKVVDAEGLESTHRELVLPISARNLLDRFRQERRAFQRGVELAAGSYIPWLEGRAEIVIGRVKPKAHVSNNQLAKIRELGPKKGRLGRGATKIAAVTV